MSCPQEGVGDGVLIGLFGFALVVKANVKVDGVVHCKPNSHRKRVDIRGLKIGTNDRQRPPREAGHVDLNEEPVGVAGDDPAAAHLVQVALVRRAVAVRATAPVSAVLDLPIHVGGRPEESRIGLAALAALLGASAAYRLRRRR